MTTKKILYASWFAFIAVTVVVVVVTWVVVLTSMQRRNRLELMRVTEAAKITSQAEWIAWHHADIAKERENFVVVRTLVLLYEKRQLLSEAEQLLDKSPNTVYAGQILHSIGVDTPEDYFSWAEKEMNRLTSDYQEIGVDGVVFPGREIHESDGFREFVKMSIICPSSERLVFVFQ